MGHHSRIMSDEAFVAKARLVLDALFADARAKSEIDFVLSLSPEFRGMMDAGWSAAEEVLRAIEDFSKFLNDELIPTRMRIRAALGFYCNMCEASGLYEVPKNLMRILSGEKHSCWPFQNLVKEHRRTGEAILPNANAVMQDLIGHAKALGRDDLADVFATAFDFELRHAYAHADYVIWSDGIRISGKHLTPKRLIPFPEFQSLLNRGARFIKLLRFIMGEYIRHYEPARVIDGSIKRLPDSKSLVSYNAETGEFKIESYPNRPSC
jgi:hypothetical protein